MALHGNAGPASLLGLSDAVLLAVFERCSAAGSVAWRAAASASTCWRLHLQGGHGMELYKTAISHAAQQMPHLTSIDCKLARPPRLAQFSDPAVADFIVCLKDLPSLRQLSITSSTSYTAISVLALGELRGLTALTLAVVGAQGPAPAADATAAGSSIPMLAPANLHPLSRLKNLQRLQISGWQPLGLQQQQHQQQQPVIIVQPGTVGSCCLPFSSLSSLQFSGVQARSLPGWLPHILACSGLQQLQLLQVGTWCGEYLDDAGSLHAALDAVVYHSTQLTSLRVAVDDKGAYCMWKLPTHISRLQQLQQLHYKSSTIGGTSRLWVLDNSSGLLKCTALRELEYVSWDLVVDGASLPHLTRLKLACDSTQAAWPDSVCPGLMSLGLVVGAGELTVSPMLARIPCVQLLTELQLDWDAEECIWDPEAESNVDALRRVAQQASNLRALHLVIPDWFAADSDEGTAAGPCLQAIGTFTQLQKLHLAFRPPANLEDSGSGVVHEDDVLRALGMLKQLQQLVLEGNAVRVSPCFVVGLEMKLPQLRVLRCIGCSGCSLINDESGITNTLRRVRRGLREGLQLLWE